MLFAPVSTTAAPINKATKDAFHRQIALINQPRLAPLQLVLGGLLLLSAVIAYFSSPPTIWDYTSAVWLNLFGAMLCGLVLLLLRFSSPRMASLAYGYAILGWGNNELFRFVAEVRLRHADHAGEALLIYYITRYLAGLGVVWRPRDLGLALALNHILLAVVFYWQGQTTIIINFAVWTTTAWLASYLLYRAERSAFIAGAQLKAQNAELAQANARLAQLNQEKTDLMAIAAHDLRSPLMGMTVLLNLTAAEAARAWSAGVSALRAIEQSCKDMADLVTRVLDAHQAEDGLGRLPLAPADIRPIVARAVDAHQPRAAAKSIALTLDLPQEPCMAMLDAKALERVLDNLGSNAVKFSPPSGRVHVRVQHGDPATGPVIAITDSGPGISDDDRSGLFRKFARLRARPTAGESSSGLGLYIVKRLVDDMGGTIAVGGLPGEGATFTVTLAPPSA
jgi:signal transduction histidine kinase